MPRFFINSDSVCGQTVVLKGEDALHISRSLRMRCGECLTLCDGCGTDFFCRINAFSKDTVTLEVERSYPSASEPPYKITVYQALVKGDKLDTVIKKSVEFGATRIVPFYSANCVVKPDSESEERKRERRAKIALEAAMQSGRGIIPTVDASVSFADMLADASRSDIPLFCYEDEHTVSAPSVLRKMRDRAADGGIAVTVGPEGGFSPAEAEAAKKAGLFSVSLGPRILRTESAAEFALACIFSLIESADK